MVNNKEGEIPLYFFNTLTNTLLIHYTLIHFTLVICNYTLLNIHKLYVVLT